MPDPQTYADRSNLAAVDAERVVLGTILYMPELLNEINLQPDDFTIIRHSWIYDAALSLYMSGSSVDLLTVTEVLQRKNQLEEIGGLAYLNELFTTTFTTIGTESHVRIIKDYSNRRRVLRLAESIANIAWNLEVPLAIEDKISQLSKAIRPSTESVSIGDALDAAMLDINAAMQRPADVWGIKTGFLDYNTYLGGIHKSEMVILSGEPGVGKSRFALQMCLDMADPNIGNTPGIIFSLEMSIKALAMRALSGESKVQTRHMKTGKLDQKAYNQLEKTVDRVRKFPIWLSSAKISPTELRAALTYHKHYYNIGWFVVDYLGLMTGFERIDERFERIGALSTAVKTITADLGLAGIVLSSVNKSGMATGQAAMTDVSGASSVQHDADVILKLIKNPEQQNIITLAILKTRDSELGTGRIDFLNSSESMWYGNLKKVDLNGTATSPVLF